MIRRQELLGGAVMVTVLFGLAACSGRPAALPVTPEPAAGVVRIEYRVLPVEGRSPDAEAVETITGILEQRLGDAGIAGGTIQARGDDRIVVELPGVTNPDPIRELLGQTGRVDFVPLPPERYGTMTTPGAYAAAQGQPLPTQETVLFSGDQIDEAYADTDTAGLRAVGFRLKSEGAKLFGDYTTANVGTFFAIVLDGSVVSAPVIQSAITGGEAMISGGLEGFTVTEVNNLVTVLASGSLPNPLEEVGLQTVGGPGGTATP